MKARTLGLVAAGAVVLAIAGCGGSSSPKLSKGDFNSVSNALVDSSRFCTKYIATNGKLSGGTGQRLFTNESRAVETMIAVYRDHRDSLVHAARQWQAVRVCKSWLRWTSKPSSASGNSATLGRCTECSRASITSRA